MALTWLSNFLEKALVSHVKRRIDMRTVRFWRSTWDVLTWSMSGEARTHEGIFLAPVIGDGLYRACCEHAPHQRLSCFVLGLTGP